MPKPTRKPSSGPGFRRIKGDGQDNPGQPVSDDAPLPDVAQARRHLQAGDVAAAERLLRAALDAQPDDAAALHLLAVARLHAGDTAAALGHAERAAALEQTALHLNTLGSLRLQQGDGAGGRDAFERALALDADFLEARLNLADALLADHDAEAAERHYRQALASAPDTVDALNNLATLLMEQDRRPEAHELLRRAAATAPDAAGVLANLANNAERLGRLDEAADAATHLGKIDPGSRVARLVQARLARREGDAARALDLLADLDTGAPDAANVQVEFERAQALDRLDRTDEAFAAVTHAHALRRALLPAAATDPGEILARVAALRAWTTPDRLARPEDTAADGPVPVFFVGFPRSGTTLLERILGAHPAVVTSGERSPLPAVRRAIAAASGYPDGLDSLDEPALAGYRDAFWREAETLGVAPGAGRVLVDKMPMNLLDLALARRLFPTAPLLMMLRDPRDATLSCLMQPFRPNVATAAFTDLASAATLCADALGLWQQMRDHLAQPWMEVRYEDLVADTMGTARRVIDFLGLPWDERIQDYRRSADADPVTTPSYADVNAAVSDRAQGRWVRYRGHMASALPILAPVVAAFDYPSGDEQ